MYALIYNSKVYGTAGVPWKFEGGVWKAGPIQIALPEVGPIVQRLPLGATGTKITPLAFRRRLTGAERIAMVVAARAQNQQGAEMQVLMDDIAVAQYIDLSDPFLSDALDVLVTRNVITADRKNEILNTPPTIDEVPNGAG